MPRLAPAPRFTCYDLELRSAFGVETKTSSM